MPNKQWLSINAQIARLEKRGMIISDRDYARRWLAHVGILPAQRLLAPLPAA